MAVSHANCAHPRTPAGRRACRANAAATGVKIAADAGVSITPTALGHVEKIQLGREIAEYKIKMTGPVARRMARHAAKADNARIQPRRSGARVPARSSSCVQAALHIDAHGGRCACGWVAA